MATLEKGPRSQNSSAAVSIGAEGARNRTGTLVIKDNVFQNDMRMKTVFVRNHTGTKTLLSGNVLRGAVDQGD